ncbi:hypothetical protein H072_7265 [Dactylellina haptotyla CBS 200.50]|uniref:Uncharacterized protein n=1 Tax=Dactylellina haptotyla (strain CBS 200.50) TaxID=1284197 RepID=S8BI63_DACHA|nr:hypothetical protein H072_7265 [Dactylellina haptotyla CBS 200.50]
MDDWATSSPWAETTNDDDDFADFQASPPPTAHGGKKGANSGEAASNGAGVANEFSPFKVKQDSFANGWGGFDDNDVSHDTDVHGGWKSKPNETLTAAATNADELVSTPERDKLKPEKGGWEYKNEWAKTEESLVPPETPNVWNRSEGWTPEPSPVKVKERIDSEGDITVPTPYDMEADHVSPVPVTITTEEVETPRKEPIVEDVPVQLEETKEDSPSCLEAQNSTLKVTDVPTRPTTPVSMGDDFGDFEDEDTSGPIEVVAEPAMSPPASNRLSQSFDIHNIDIDNFALGNLSVLDSLYKTKPFRLPAGSDASDIISTTTQRKTWYKLTRKESARNSIQGEDVLRVRWTGSETQKKVHDIVKRWISEDRMGGRAMLGRSTSGMFDWNSTSPRSSTTVSPTKSAFPPPKSRFDPPAKRLSFGLTSPATPRSAGFGWSSTQSPRNPSFGWGSSGAAVASNKAPSQSPSLDSPQSIRSPASSATFHSPPKQPPTPRHVASSSVEIPRPKQSPAGNRPTSLYIGTSSNTLFGELSITSMKSPPAASTPKTHSTKSSMDLSIFDKPPTRTSETTQPDSLFGDDFGDFEGSGFSTPSQPKTNLPTAKGQATAPLSQPEFAPSTTVSLAAPSLISNPPPKAAPKAASMRSSLDIATRPVPTDPIVPPNLGKPYGASSVTPAPLSVTDPWGSFDIFDDPKPAATTTRQARPASPTKISTQVSTPKTNGKAGPPKPLALPVISPPKLTQTPADNNSSAIADDDFDDWGEMITTSAVSEQKTEWPSTPTLSVNGDAPPVVRRRSFTLDMFGSPDENITSANPKELFPDPQPSAVNKRIPSPISIQHINAMPTIPATPSPGATSLFSSNILTPQRTGTSNAPSHASSTHGTPDVSRRSSPAPQNGGFGSLNSLSSLSITNVKVEEATVNSKRLSTPVLPTQQTSQAQTYIPKVPVSLQPSVSSPLSSEWGDVDFGSFEEATPKPEAKPVAVVKSTGHRPTASTGNISTQQPYMKHTSRGSVTMAPIMGKKSEDSAFTEIIDLLPDLGYMLK